MLDPWIIEEIRRREEEQRQRDEQRGRFEIHIETPNDSHDRSSGRPQPGPMPGSPGGSSDRGVTIIDFSV